MRYIFIALALLLFFSTCFAQDSNNEMRTEIRHLFGYLKNSGCEFNRNGKWYNAEEAVKHIDKKYQYLIKKGLVNSTEQFIDRAASESSMSGKPYLVRCGDAEPAKCSVWFKSELARYRKKTFLIK